MDYPRDIQAHQQKLSAIRRDKQLINERIRHEHDQYHTDAQQLRKKSDDIIKDLERQLDRLETNETREEDSLKQTEERLRREARK